MLNIKVYGVSGDFIVRGRAVSTKVLAALIICKDSTPECVDKKTRLRIYRVQKNPSYYSKESVAYARIIRNLPFRGLLISTQSSMRMAFLSIFTTSTWFLQKQFFVTPLRFHLELGLWRCTITTPVWNIFQKNFLLFPCWLCVNYSYYSLSNTRSKKSFAFDMKTTEWFNPASHQVCVSHEFLLWSLKKVYFLWADSPKC